MLISVFVIFVILLLASPSYAVISESDDASYATLTLTPSTFDTKIILDPGFGRLVIYRGEVVNLGDRTVYWNGNGNILLQYLNVDDRLVLTTSNGAFDKSFQYNCWYLVPQGPFDITYLFKIGKNIINIKVVDVCGVGIGAWEIAITGEGISETPFPTPTPSLPDLLIAPENITFEKVVQP